MQKRSPVRGRGGGNRGEASEKSRGGWPKKKEEASRDRHYTVQERTEISGQKSDVGTSSKAPKHTTRGCVRSPACAKHSVRLQSKGQLFRGHDGPRPVVGPRSPRAGAELGSGSAGLFPFSSVRQ